MNEYVSINDPTFDQKVTLRDAYQIMQRFLGWHFHRGMQNTGLLLGDLSLLEDGVSSDPHSLTNNRKIGIIAHIDAGKATLTVVGL